MNDDERMLPAAEALIESGRTLDSPDDRDRARIRARLTAALGVSAISAAGTQVAAASLAAEGVATAASGGGLGASTAAHGAGAAHAAGAVGASATAGKAAIGVTAATAGTVASGAGTAAVSGGMFGALGAKLMVASVMAATTVGAALGTGALLRHQDANATVGHSSSAPLATASPKPAPTRDLATNSAPKSIARSNDIAQPVPGNQPVAATAKGLPSDQAASRVEVPSQPPAAAVLRARPLSGADPTATAAAPLAESARASAARNPGARANDSGSATHGSTANRARVARTNTDAAASAAALQTTGGVRTPPAASAASAAGTSPGTSTAAAISTLNANPAGAPPDAARATPGPAGSAPSPSDSSAPETTARTAASVTVASPALSNDSDRGSKLPALSGELKLLASAQQALRDDQLARALTLLNEHATRYPQGALRPERLAARAVALCRMGEKNPGRAEVQKLETETPRSPLIRWARGICGL